MPHTPEKDLRVRHEDEASVTGPISPDAEIEEGQLVLCAADQAPFDVETRGGGANTFCVLVPLISESGRVVQDREHEFPNRGRIWWMLRSEIDPDCIEPGTLCTIRVERAVDFGDTRPDKDHHQAQRHDAVVGAGKFIEVLRLDRDLEPRDLLSDRRFELPRPPGDRVMFIGPKFLIGPFKTDWDFFKRSVSFSAVRPGDPIVWRMPLKKLPKGSIHDFNFTSNRWDKRQSDETIKLSVVHDRLLELLEEEGEELDAADDNQVMNWGMRLIESTKREKQAVREALEATRAMSNEIDGPQGRLDRFKNLCGSLSRVLALSDEVAASIAEQEGFEKLIEKHIDRVAEDRVQQEIEEHRDEINAKVAEEKARYDRLQSEIAHIESDFHEKVKAQEEEFKAENETRLRRLKEREDKISETEERLEGYEQGIESRLERLLLRYRDGAGEISDEILAQLPILKTLGIGSSGSEAGGGGTLTGLSMPLFLERERGRGGLTEPEFLDQFCEVSRQRGFVFDRDDLANFHISVKAGLWTVLAGASGTGKSSLPRLYAEALGVSDEMLWIPVRPDWMDDRDIIGGFNSLSGQFEPAPCGLVDRLIAAHEDHRSGRGGIYLICLDEMNLARVEHYFAHFLSVMELPEDRRRLMLFSRGVERANDPYGAYRQLPLAPNLRFVGTVNIDETTQFFSPKVIDRASLLHLEAPDLGDSTTVTDIGTRLGGLAPVHDEEYKGWIRRADRENPARERILELNEVLKKHRSGLAHRTARRMLDYIASAEGLLSGNRAFDLAFSQIVIPRLRTTAPEFVKLIQRLRMHLHENHFPRSAALLDDLEEAGGEYDFFQVI